MPDFLIVLTHRLRYRWLTGKEAFMITVLSVFHVFLIFFLVLLVLIQSGKGAEISASFGGSSQTVFGSSGGANFFQKLTAVTAALFMVSSMALTLVGAKSQKSVFDTPSTTTPAQTAPLDAVPPAESQPPAQPSTPAPQ